MEDFNRPNSPELPPTPGTASSRFDRLHTWLNQRTGIDDVLKESLDEPIPGGARLAYVFGSGLIFIFISQIITGLCLALYYVPSAESAHTSVAYITKQVAAGAFLRSLHYYGSSAMIIVLLLHFLQTFLYGSYKGRREVLWLSGALLSLFVLGMGFTGYLLPWDQKAYFATAVGTNIVGQVPFIGEWLTRLLRGGDTLGTLTLSRFYVAHVFLIPGAILGFIALHILLFRKAGPAGPIHEDPIEPKLAPEGFYPRQVLMDMGFALLLMIGLGILAYFHPVELGPVANPADTQFLPRPEWYYLPMFEWLKYWEGPKVVFAIVVIPGILALLFFLLPFLDRSLERRPWRRPIPLLGVSIVLLGLFYLGIKSHLDDTHDPAIVAQIAAQDQQEQAYSKAPFQPYVESPGGPASAGLPTGPVDPLVARGKAIFSANGCSGCHGVAGVGAIAPTLVGITTKYPGPQLINLLHNPNARMQAGRMPAIDISAADMNALAAYLGALGTAAANVPAVYTLEPAAAETVAATGTRAASARPASPEIAAGQQFFQSHGCFACHGVDGAGGRAPALAPLLAELSDTRLKTLLAAPNAKMKAGGMAPVVATPAELTGLIAYLRSLPKPGASAPATLSTDQAAGQRDQPATGEYASTTPAATTQQAASAQTSTQTSGQTSGQTSTPTMQTTAATSPAVLAQHAAGRALFVANGCAACHGPYGQGTHFAPSLVGIGEKFPGDKLPYLLHHPTAKMKNGGMPAVTLNDTDLTHLIHYLTALGTPAAQPQQIAASTVASKPGSGHASAPANGQPQPATPSAGTSSSAARPVAPPSPQAIAGRKLFVAYSCETCHGIGGLHGTVAAPGLAGTASILPASMLENLLRHHSKAMQQGGMPLTNANPHDMAALVAYIRSMPAESAQ